jgi:hypothetical protein
MLIDKNIKNILGGGYNVSEVKYMDRMVWKKGPSAYKFKYSMHYESKIYGRTVSINDEKINPSDAVSVSSGEKMMKIYVSFTVLTSTRHNLKVDINGKEIINTIITGVRNYEGLYAFSYESEFATNILSENNVVNIIIL